MIARLIIYLIIGGAVFYSTTKFQINYRYEDLKDYIGLLSNVSAMVFTIMGIWIAFLYPNALNRLVSPKKLEVADFSETLDDTRRLERIVAAVLQSALVLTVALVVLAGKTVFYKSGLYADHHLLIKSVTLSVVAVISAMQIDAVLAVALANVMFINDLHRKRREKQSDSDI